MAAGSGRVGDAKTDASWTAVAAASVVVAVAASALAVACLDQLDHVYSWDQLFYHEKAVRLSHEFRESFVRPWPSIAASVRQSEYNDLAALPLAAWVSLFGEARVSLVLGILVLYALPTSVLFSILMGTALRRFCGRSSTTELQVGWMLIPWLIGAFWTPTLLGRVGVAGLGLVFAAVTVHIRRPVDEQRWWEPIIVGGLLGAAVLIRRWYAFAAAGVLATIATESVAALLRPRSAAARVGIVTRLSLSVLTPTCLLAAVAAPALSKIALADLADVFGPHQHPGSFAYLWGNRWSLSQRLGPPSALVVALAYGVGLLERRWRGFMLATTLAGAVSLALFARLQAPGVHHSLIWVGVACVWLGVGLAEAWTWPRAAARVVVGASAIALATSVAGVLFFSRSADAPPAPVWRRLAPTLTVGDFLPRNRSLVDAAVSFVEQNVPPESSIVLVSSGLNLNNDGLRKIRFSLPDSDFDRRYRVLRLRHLSRHGRFPEVLLRADYVVVVTPTAAKSRANGWMHGSPAQRLFRPDSSLTACFDRVAGPAELPDGRAISALRLRPQDRGRARLALSDELEVVFSEGRPLDTRR